MILTSGYIAYPKKYVCDGACKVTKKGKVLSIDLKYCFKVGTDQIRKILLPDWLITSHVT